MILNLTKDLATQQQKDSGVVDLPGHVREDLIELLDFDEPPTREEIEARAHDIAELACYNCLAGDDGDDPMPSKALIGGEPYLMSTLERELFSRRIQPVYAFKKCVTVEEASLPEGWTSLNLLYQHVGFVEAVLA